MRRASTDMLGPKSCDGARPCEKRRGGVAFTYVVNRAPANPDAAERKNTQHRVPRTHPGFASIWRSPCQGVSIHGTRAASQKSGRALLIVFAVYTVLCVRGGHGVRARLISAKNLHLSRVRHGLRQMLANLGCARSTRCCVFQQFFFRPRLGRRVRGSLNT